MDGEDGRQKNRHTDRGGLAELPRPPLSAQDLELQPVSVGPDWHRSSREGALSLQSKASQATDTAPLQPPKCHNCRSRGSAFSSPEGPLPHTLRNPPPQTSEVTPPPSPMSQLFHFRDFSLRAGDPPTSVVPRGSREPGQPPSVQKATLSEPPPACSGRLPAPPGRPRPPNLQRAEKLPPAASRKQTSRARVHTQSPPAGLPSPGPLARRTAPGLTWCPPRRGGAGGGGSGSGLEKEVRAGGWRKWGGPAGQPGRGAGAGPGGAGPDQEVRRPGPPALVSPPPPPPALLAAGSCPHHPHPHQTPALCLGGP
ncbi:uncharacterized protein LOC113593735 [Acinonyx jubatus]|uniref:Uncharacterized protein LOC113593735 n=1 Tax=Acinonyx jubatus TaxID=32536 RepID=A0A6J1XST3_ACIJB|nr:uncharacterized protein LOC113593735 [Acinonyx jubatus]